MSACEHCWREAKRRVASSGAIGGTVGIYNDVLREADRLSSLGLAVWWHKETIAEEPARRKEVPPPDTPCPPVP